MESFYGRELRVKKTALLGMWYSGFGFIAGTLYMFYLMSDDSQIIRVFGPLIIVVVSFCFLWSIQKFAMALKWSFARVTLDDMGITLRTLSGSDRIDWMNVESFDYLDKRGAISLTGRTGEKLNLIIGLEEFPDVLRVILEKLRKNIISTAFSNRFTSRRFSMFSTFLTLAAIAAMALTSMFWTHYKIGLLVGIVVIIGIWIWEVSSGLKWVEVENSVIRIKYIWHTQEVAIDDVSGVSVNLKNSGQKEKASLVLALDVVTSEKPVEIPFRGPDLLPLYMRLKQIIPSGSSH